jgi:DNA polymerase type B, organellar and viral
MDNLTNKRIKISRSTIIGGGFLGNKPLKSGLHTNALLNRFYTTSNKNTDKYLSYITPLKPNNKISKIINISNEGKPFSAMDIETMEFNNKEIPICISIKTKNFNKIFLIDSSKLLNNLNRALEDLWDNFFDFILNNCNKEVIFVHNLGNFDGFFIYKALSNKFKPEEVSCLIDHHNKFIQIILNISESPSTSLAVAMAKVQGQKKNKVKIVFKDSYRIFPVSLNDLCKILSIPGKTSNYKPEYHNLNLFNSSKLLEEFKEYSLQDSNSLFDCISILQNKYLISYNVDITTIVSTSTLSLKIFRSKFLQEDIPIFKRIDDTFIRKAYFGGATDYYKLKAFNIHYYDVNSLYPFAMCKSMPFKLINKIKFLDNSGFNLNNFFGYLKVEVICPKDIKVPVLPCKHKT